MSLDLAVARAVHGALLLERALHESTGWHIEVGGLAVPVIRTVLSSGVVFHASLPAIEFALPPECVSLYHRDVLQAVRPFDADGGGEAPFDVVFELRLEEPVSVGE